MKDKVIKITTPERNLKRDELRKQFKETLDNLVVLDQRFKNEIFYQFCTTENRLKAEKLHITKNWDARESSKLLIEYNSIKDQIQLLSIFSDKLERLLWRYWHELVGTFRPDNRI